MLSTEGVNGQDYAIDIFDAIDIFSLLKSI